MASNRVKLYRLLVLDVELDASAALAFSSEMFTWSTTLAATSGRQPVKVPLPGNAKGRLVHLALTPTGTARLYGALLYGKRLNEPGEVAWGWSPGPVEGTPEEWQAQPLEIPATEEAWKDAQLEIPVTEEAWKEAQVPIPPTPEEWTAQPLVRSSWEAMGSQIPVSPDGWADQQLPIPPTPDEWSLYTVPIPPTPDLPQWAALTMDA